MPNRFYITEAQFESLCILHARMIETVGEFGSEDEETYGKSSDELLTQIESQTV